MQKKAIKKLKKINKPQKLQMSTFSSNGFEEKQFPLLLLPCQ